MRVLLMGTDTGEDSVATQALQRDGHDVVRCHPPDQPAFPCAALVDGWHCPLEHDVVDAAVIVGTGTEDQIDVGAEEGSRCALRLHVPLVTVGYHYASPLVPWATESITRPEDLGHAVVRAAQAPMRAHEEAASEAFRQVLDTHDVATTGTRVTVRRYDRGLRAELHTDADLAPHIGEIASVRALAALRVVDPHASTIGVGFRGNVVTDEAAAPQD
jgi:hypothetical protein